ncbi:nucleotide sugar dehydrogenase [Dyadobacter sandarakinus]|uniref:UDP-glucose 6-dehydrogenase n=1 Tax=Dyadobacter sandarakinus TaxID=2747268 RepID=A0ABX7I0C6_9BACT|nr:UDP-glucose/GDP-mannose dehydrogenase family protein [Dyadobacter sandarakinus]QRQ99463.1 UDP-glucose/GDP-mannose dehydrogenase family protein [Dyadobacter sandarakinus]
MNISIFGLGYVGCVSLGCLAKNGHTVVGVDVSQDKVNQINNGQATIVEKDIDQIIADQHEAGRISATTDFKAAVVQTELSIVAVGTPSSSKGHLNLDYIFNVARNIGEVLKEKDAFHVVALRSTVLPGTCEKFAHIIEDASGKKANVDFAVVDNPEFLREGTAVQDYYNPPLTLIGGENEQATSLMASLYQQLPAEVIITDTKTAEIMKYVNNTFHALKISFANEVGNISSALGIDSHKVMEIFCKDKQLNISPYYFKPGFAYGGSCLPKDLKGLQTLAHDLYVKVPLIDSIDETNTIQIQRAVSLLSRFFGKRIGILGLSFKAGTDDLRNSPSVELVETLVGKGFDISIYDSNIQIAKLTGKNKDYIESRIPHLSKLLVDNLDYVVEKSDVLVVCNKEQQFVEKCDTVSGKTIVDLVRLPEGVKENNQYFGINW